MPRPSAWPVTGRRRLPRIGEHIRQHRRRETAGPSATERDEMSFMHHSRPPSQPSAPAGRLLSGRDRAAALFLAILIVLLAAGFVLAPRALTGAGPAHEHSLSAATSQAFTAYWQSARRSYPPALADLVAYWRRYHVAKTGFAVALTIALCLLAHMLWRSLLRAGRLRPSTTTAAVVSASAVTALAFGSVLVVTATIQGALAPFSSLVSLLPVGHGDSALTAAARQIRHDLAEHQALPRTPPPLGAIIDDFQRYHAVLAAQAAILAVVLIGLSMLMWRRAHTAGRAVPRAKPLLRLLATAFALFTAIILIIGAANLSTALNPDPALQLVFGG